MTAAQFNFGADALLIGMGIIALVFIAWAVIAEAKRGSLNQRFDEDDVR